MTIFKSIPTNNQFTPLVDYPISDDECDTVSPTETDKWVTVTRNRTRNKKKRETKVSIIGSSLVRDLGHFVDDEAQSIRACSYPHPGYRAEQIQRRLSSLISPKDDIVVILGGTNNIPNESVANCINRIDDLINKAQELKPEGPIIVPELPDRFDDPKHMDSVREINTYLNHTCRKSNTLHLLKNEFVRRDFGRDGLHFTPEGKQKFGESIKALVKSIRR